MSKTIVTGILASLLLAACSSTPEQIDRVVDNNIYIGPPAPIVRCPEPLKLTAEQIAAIETEADLVEFWIIPNFTRHETCHRNMTRIEEWIAKNVTEQP